MVIGAYIGRFCPLHIGHQAVIDEMIKEVKIENCRLFIGSTSKDMSFRHIFTCQQRVGFIKKLYPNLWVAPIPDYPTDQEWLRSLDDMIYCSAPDADKVIFFGGCKEDVDFFIEDGRDVKIMNRFDGSTPEISATKIRDSLIAKLSIKEWVDPEIWGNIMYEFAKNWDILRSR